MVQYIGKLDKNKLGKYRNKIITEDVIITEERIEHIKEHHPKDYEGFGKYMKVIVECPDYVLEDNKNKDTLLFLKEIKEKNINVQIVVRLNTNKKEKDKLNSILTFWKIKNRTYKQLIRNKRNIWNSIDKSE